MDLYPLLMSDCHMWQGSMCESIVSHFHPCVRDKLYNEFMYIFLILQATKRIWKYPNMHWFFSHKIQRESHVNHRGYPLRFELLLSKCNCNNTRVHPNVTKSTSITLKNFDSGCIVMSRAHFIDSLSPQHPFKHY